MTPLRLVLLSLSLILLDSNCYYPPISLKSVRFASRSFSTIPMPCCNSSLLSRRRRLLFLRAFRTAFSAFRSARQRFIPRNCAPGRDLQIFLTTKYSWATWLQPWTDCLHELSSLSAILGRRVLFFVEVSVSEGSPRNAATLSTSEDLMGAVEAIKTLGDIESSLVLLILACLQYIQTRTKVVPQCSWFNSREE